MDFEDGIIQGERPNDGGPLLAAIRPAGTPWDCSRKLWLLLDVENRGNGQVLVRAEVSSEKNQGWGSNKGAVVVPVGQTKTLPVLIIRGEVGERTEELTGLFDRMRGYPGGHQQTSWRVINASLLNRVKLEFFTDAESVDCKVSNLRGAVDFQLPTMAELKKYYVPATDQYGQNRHADWKFKIKSNEDLAATHAAELQWLEQFKTLEDRTRYGGWTGNVQFEATGHFRTVEKNGVWWLVDPEGHPFWSLGATGFNLNLGRTKTPGIGSWNPRQSNLKLKFGEAWQEEYSRFTHDRIRAWGMNTLGNWSSPDFYRIQKTPYVVAVHFRRPSLHEPDDNAHSSLPDVFHPGYREAVFKAVEKFPKEAVDPWCIGFFIDNELPFQQPVTPAQKALQSGADNASRMVFIAQLKEKYATIGALNKVWKSDFARWDAVAPVKGKWSEERNADLVGFSEAWYRKYYSICRDAMRAGAPDKLYLGSRINHTENSSALNICSEYADVVSINFYDYTPNRFEPPEGFNAPVIIGEYHFGTVSERGLWGSGLCSGMDIQQASDLFRNYTREAVKNRLIVGSHWFKFSDQPLTGRADGENYRIGFVDVTDTPYPEMVKACRAVSDEMYTLRNALEKE
ncbi:hypothetical protein [Pontiella desulfatans]|nr:hypothetical protein [Pontiella desulfatans]